MRTSPVLAFIVVCGLLVSATLPGPARGQSEVTTEPPHAAQPAEPCPKGKRGGAIGGIVVGSVFLWVLPMSIPVLITQTKKLKAHNKAKLERRCQYAPR